MPSVSDLLSPPAQLTGNTIAVYGPWAVQAAAQLGSDAARIEAALRGFVDGQRFGHIAQETGLSRDVLLRLYRMPWMRAVWLASARRPTTAQTDG